MINVLRNQLLLEMTTCPSAYMPRYRVVSDALVVICTGFSFPLPLAFYFIRLYVPPVLIRFLYREYMDRHVCPRVR